MANTINLLGFLFDDAGAALSGTVLVEAYITNTLGAPSTAVYATGSYSAGKWQIDSLNDSLYYEVKLTSGSQVRRVRGAAKTQVQELAVMGLLKVPDGAVGAPGLPFVQDLDTGLYRISANRLGLAIGGVKALDVSPTMFDFSTFDLNLGTGKNIRVADAVPYRSIVLTAGGGWPSTTNGCATWAKVEAATNKQNLYYLDFNKDTAQYCEWTTVMPDGWNGGTVTATFYWLASAATTGSVIWGLQGRSYGDNEAIDQAWGTAQEVTDAWQANSAVHITAATAAITLAGTPAGGEAVQWRAYRNAPAAGDTLDANARLIAVKIKYGVNAFSD